MNDNHFDVIILGGGAAGLTAGIYLSRAKMKTLIVNEGTAGGQMVLTHEIANYPGVESTGGYMLGSTMRKQAQTFGATIFNNSKIFIFEWHNFLFLWWPIAAKQRCVFPSSFWT